MAYKAKLKSIMEQELNSNTRESRCLAKINVHTQKVNAPGKGYFIKATLHNEE